MESASEELDFEKAAIMRDKIKSLNIIQSSLTVTEANLIEADVIAGYKDLVKPVFKFFIDLSRTGVTKHFFLNMMRRRVSRILYLLSFLNFMKIRQFLA